MSIQSQFIRRDPMEIEPWAETCGSIRCLIEESDGAAAEVHYVEIDQLRFYRPRHEPGRMTPSNNCKEVCRCQKIPIQPGERVPLKLTAAERKLILDDVMCLGTEYDQMLRDTPSGKPVMMTLDDLDDFGGYIAAEANHCEDKKKQKKLDAVFQKTQEMLNKYTDQEPPKTPCQDCHNA